MKVVAFDAPGDAAVLHVADMPTPTAGDGEILIAVRAAGISRADILQRRGLYPPPAGASAVLGLEVAGSVVAIGAGVTLWKPGDEVCALCNGGGYAQYVSVPQGQVLPVPDHWNAIEAATLPENAFTVYDNVFTRAGLEAGETILVHGGSSGIGTTAIMFATALRSRAIATAGSAAKCRACVQLGAIAAIDYTTADFVAEVLRLTQDRGADVVLDIVGGDYIPRDLQCLALDGRVACIALQRGRTTELDLGVLLAKRAKLLGSHLRGRSSNEKAEIAQRLREHIWPLLPSRTAIVPVVDAVYPFERAADAHARLEAGAHIGKIVLSW